MDGTGGGGDMRGDGAVVGNSGGTAIKEAVGNRFLACGANLAGVFGDAGSTAEG